jgi:hypothetical protein
MDKISVYYDYRDDVLCPVWMIIQCPGTIQNEVMDISIEAPFERFKTEDFNNDVMSLSIFQSELTVNPYKPTHFGINIRAVSERIKKEVDLFEVEQFIIQIIDIEEVLQLDCRKYYDFI